MAFRIFVALNTLVAVGFLISGLDDFFIDVYYWWRELYRSTWKRSKVRPISKNDMDAVPEKWVAVYIPAWQEDAVIQKMLANLLQSFDYENFDVFVGTYPNDEPTSLAVAKAREQSPRVRNVVCPHDGPTNKADCLNWIYQGMLLAEREKGIRYEIVVMHDAEDIVHPLELKLFNYLIPRKDMVQLPVVPLEMPARYFTAGTYLDEFAENHSKDLLVRERLSRMIPSAGVGTAIVRRALDELASQHRNEPFNTSTVTEDYEFGFRLADLKMTSIFAKFRVLRTQRVTRGFWRKRQEIRQVRELVAVREFFPDRFGLAVRQKSRWILGIALQGWKNIGWPEGVWRKYMAYRDRKALVANILNVLGYAVLGYWLVLRYVRAGSVSFLQHRWIWYVILADTFLMVERFLQRAVAVRKISGLRQALLSIPRFLLLNLINFAATMLAIKQFLLSELAGQRITWAKTSHTFPSAVELQAYRRKLGDLLLESRLITVAQLHHALEFQQRSGRRLGTVLSELGYLSEKDLVATLGSQLRVPTCEIDLLRLDLSPLEKLPQGFAERYLVLPLRRMDGHLDVASASLPTPAFQKELEKRLDCPIKLLLAGEKELRAAIPRAYLQCRSTERPLHEETPIAGRPETENGPAGPPPAPEAGGAELREVPANLPSNSASGTEHGGETSIVSPKVERAS